MREKQPRREGPPERESATEQQIDESSEESFPASDPPSAQPLHPGSPAPPEPTHPRR